MRMELLFFWTVALLTAAGGSLHAWPDPTRGGSGVNLSGKMFTCSRDNGRLVFYSPNRPPPWASPTPYQTSGYTSGYQSTATPSYTQTNTGSTETSTQSTTTSSYTTPGSTPSYTPTSSYTTPGSTPSYTPTRSYTTPPWSTAPSTRGVTVCLRYMMDISSSRSIFTLGSDGYLKVQLSDQRLSSFILTFGYYYSSVSLVTDLKLWSGLRPNAWTSACFTVDSVKGVAQAFRDSNMSVRKLLTFPCVWSGEPLIDFSGFEGELTDVQVWDYALSGGEVFYYMSSGSYGPYRGSVLSWSDISYSMNGRTLLEDGYPTRLRQPDCRRGGRCRLKGQKKRRRLLRTEESKDRRDNF